MMELDVTKIESNELIVRTFGEKALFQDAGYADGCGPYKVPVALRQ